MTSKLKLLVATSAVSVAMMGVNPAFAADLGTDAGTGITNNVTVNYNVGGTPQTAETDSDTFVVDRKVDLLIQEANGANTTVAPDEDDAAVTYTVTNLTNDTIDVLLTSEQPGGDDFDVDAPVTYYLDGGDGIYNFGEPGSDDTVITSIEDLAEDETVTVHAVADVPAGVDTGDTADLILIGQAADTAGVAFADNSGDADDAAIVQNVFADAAGTGTGDDANDGFHSATDTYEVAAAAVSVLKSSLVISDPVSGTSNPKAIPGAVVEYCISVANGAGSATASGVSISDTLPANVTFVTGSILVDATATISAGPPATQTCAGGTAGGSFSDPVVSGTLSDIAAGTNRALIFRVTVD